MVNSVLKSPPSIHFEREIQPLYVSVQNEWSFFYNFVQVKKWILLDCLREHSGKRLCEPIGLMKSAPFDVTPRYFHP